MSRVKKWNIPADIPRRTEYKPMKKWHLNVGGEKGSGGFGIVSKGTLSRLMVPREYVDVAVKEQNVADHEHEVSMLSQLSHQNIVPLLGAYVENDRGYLVVPMYKSSLDKWKGPCEDILMDVLRGLKYLEEKNIVHSDIKPGNICVRETEEGPHGVIIDFGLAKMDGEPDRGYTPIYRDAYFDFNGSSRINKKPLDHRYDLFCLSVVAGEVDATDRARCLELKADLLDLLLPEPLLYMQSEQQLRL